MYVGVNVIHLFNQKEIETGTQELFTGIMARDRSQVLLKLFEVGSVYRHGIPKHSHKTSRGTIDRQLALHRGMRSKIHQNGNSNSSST